MLTVLVDQCRQRTLQECRPGSSDLIAKTSESRSRDLADLGDFAIDFLAGELPYISRISVDFDP